MVDEDGLRRVAATKGRETETYHKALEYVQHACRDHGIDAALKRTTSNGEAVELDALLLCDRLGVGQQIAAQAGQHPFPSPILLPILSSLHRHHSSQRSWLT